jgi:hypothetical protein
MDYFCREAVDEAIQMDYFERTTGHAPQSVPNPEATPNDRAPSLLTLSARRP